MTDCCEGFNKSSKRKRRRAEQLEQRIPKQIRVLPIIEPKRRLIEVGGQMLGGELMVRADDGPLEEGPSWAEAGSRGAEL